MANDRERLAFFKLGVQYYVAARLATFAKQDPVCANLFHHALEMLMKGVLAHKGSDLDALRKLGHQLLKIWEAFKVAVADATLDRFDGTIAALDKWERLRYPDCVLKEGMQASVCLVAGYPPTHDLNRPESTYDLVVPEVDALVGVIFDKGSVNPVFFTCSLNAEAREALQRDPKAAIAP